MSNPTGRRKKKLIQGGWKWREGAARGQTKNQSEKRGYVSLIGTTEAFKMEGKESGEKWGNKAAGLKS